MTTELISPEASAVAKAIARHEVAQAAYDDASAACEARPDDKEADEIAWSLFDAACKALAELAETPCADDAELIEKLRAMFDADGGPLDFDSIGRAVALHFGRGGT